MFRDSEEEEEVCSIIQTITFPFGLLVFGFATGTPLALEGGQGKGMGRFWVPSGSTRDREVVKEATI